MTDVALFVLSAVAYTWYRQRPAQKLHQALLDGTTLHANDIVMAVDAQNKEMSNDSGSGWRRATVRLHNHWHRATYILVRHEPTQLPQHGSDSDLNDVYVMVVQRSQRRDYGPTKLDPTPGNVVRVKESYRDNARRTLQEQLGITLQNPNQDLKRLFTFSFQNNDDSIPIRVWGECYEAHYRGTLQELNVNREEINTAYRLSLSKLQRLVTKQPHRFTPDTVHVLQLYLQHKLDVRVQRRLFQGYHSSDMDAYGLRPRPAVIFFDCDDCLYFDHWVVANLLTSRINDYCVHVAGLKHGQAYDLYKQYGTALRGLLAEGYLENTRAATDAFLAQVHDIPIHEHIAPDPALRQMLLRLDPAIPKFIFTASVKEHAERCLKALGIDDLFQGIIDCNACHLETKHSPHSFHMAMQAAGVTDPSRCLFFDDSTSNIRTAREMGWRAVLVGRIARDGGHAVTLPDHAELEMDRIHDMEQVLPDLFVASSNHNENGQDDKDLVDNDNYWARLASF